MNEVPDFLRVANRDKPMAKPLVHSYSALHTYRDVCPHQYQQRYILKTLPFVETPAVKRGNDIHAAFEHRVGAGRPLPPDMTQWEKYAQPFDGRGAVTEQKLGIAADGRPVEFFGKDVWLRGKVDTTLMNGTAAYFVDWKSGSSAYEDRFELDVCALLLHAKHPHLRTITGRYAWLKDDRLGQPYDLSETRKTWYAVLELVEAIDGDLRRGEFEKRQGPLCGYCDVKTCEHNRKK